MKVYFETYGCSHNFADTIYMKNKLKGHEVTNNLSNADAVVINTCSVKNRTAYNFKQRLKEIENKYPGKKIIIAGCLPQASKVTNFTEIPQMTNYSLVGPNNLDDIQLAIDSSTNIQKIDGKKKTSRLDYHTHQAIEIIPISTGCLSACTFCHTKLARGHLQSFSPEEIIARITDAVQNGTKIVYLTSQDNGCYGFDIGTNLAQLLEKICIIDGEFMIRIGMGNPVHIKKFKEELLEVMKHPKIFKFLHIPIQSASDEVLLNMKRDNTIKEMNEIIEYARKQIPNITIATDIIAGFPTETEADFNATISWINEYAPAVINRAKYSARPGTVAARMKQVSTNEMTRRSHILTAAVEKASLDNNTIWENWQGDAIAEDVKKAGTMVLRNEFYKPIVVRGKMKIGEKTHVKITGITIWHLEGELLAQK